MGQKGPAQVRLCLIVFPSGVYVLFNEGMFVFWRNRMTDIAIKDNENSNT